MLQRWLMVALVAVNITISIAHPVSFLRQPPHSKLRSSGNFVLWSVSNGHVHWPRPYLPNDDHASRSLGAQGAGFTLHLRGGQEMSAEVGSAPNSPTMAGAPESPNVRSKSPDVKPITKHTEPEQGNPEKSVSMSDQDGQAAHPESGIAIEELVAMGRVAMAEQNYSIAADYLSAALRQQADQTDGDELFGPTVPKQLPVGRVNDTETEAANVSETLSQLRQIADRFAAAGLKRSAAEEERKNATTEQASAAADTAQQDTDTAQQGIDKELGVEHKEEAVAGDGGVQHKEEAVGDADAADEEGDEEEEEGDEGEEQGGQAESGEGDAGGGAVNGDEELDIRSRAWEVLDTARVILQRVEKLNFKQEMMLADVHMRLGDLHCYNELYDKCYEDYASCLAIRTKLCLPHDRRLLEAHYICGMTLIYMGNPRLSPGLKHLTLRHSSGSEGVSQLRSAVQVCKNKIQVCEGDREKTEFSGILSDLERRIEDEETVHEGPVKTPEELAAEEHPPLIEHPNEEEFEVVEPLPSKKRPLESTEDEHTEAGEGCQQNIPKTVETVSPTKIARVSTS